MYYTFILSIKYVILFICISIDLLEAYDYTHVGTHFI